MLFLTNDDIKQVLTMKDCIRVLEEGEREHARGELVARPRIDTLTSTLTPHRFYRWGTMEGTSKRLQTHVIRMKSDVVYWQNVDGRVVEEKYASKPGLFCGLIFLFDTNSGEPLAIMHEGYLQHMRVGARNSLGVKYLAKEGSHNLAMLGSGGMARSHLVAYCHVRSIKQVKVFSPTRNHREAYAKEMEELLGIKVEPVGSAMEAVKGADVVAACTNSMLPVFSGDMIEPGMHLTHVSNEFSDDVLPRIDVALDFAENRIFRGKPIPRSQGAAGAALVYGAASAEDLEEIVATSGFRYSRKPDKTSPAMKVRRVPLAQLISGTAQGRLHEEEISSSAGRAGGEGGQGLAFVTVGRLVYDLAKKKGLGVQMPTELFLQDIRD